MSNNGPYADIDTQEYYDGPLTLKCQECGLPMALCACSPSSHTVPDDTTAVVGWWPVAIFAVVALAAGAIAVHGWGWPL